MHLEMSLCKYQRYAYCDDSCFGTCGYVAMIKSKISSVKATKQKSHEKKLITFSIAKERNLTNFIQINFKKSCLIKTKSFSIVMCLINVHYCRTGNATRNGNGKWRKTAMATKYVNTYELLVIVTRKLRCKCNSVQVSILKKCHRFSSVFNRNSLPLKKCQNSNFRDRLEVDHLDRERR